MVYGSQGEENVMKFHILTLFPEMILYGLRLSIIGKAVDNNIISINAVDIRDYSMEKHRKVDDYPYGGGAGMLMQAQPVYNAHKAVTDGRKVRTIYVTPQGIPFSQTKAEELAAEEELVLLCGHYEGIDERVLEEIVTDYISIGDYVLTGGELPAMVMVDAIARLIPGVLGNDISSEEESFHNDLLEYPQYSRPEVWHGKKVPEVLLSGNHSKVAAWRLAQSMLRTADRRPDLYARYQARQLLIKQLSREKRNHIHMMESLARGCSDILYMDYGTEEIIKTASIAEPLQEKICAENAEGINVLLYDTKDKICMLSAKTAVSGDKLAHILPETAEYIVTSQAFMDKFLTRIPEEVQGSKSQYQLCGKYFPMLYTRKVALPVKCKSIRSLSVTDLPLLECFEAEFYNSICCNRINSGVKENVVHYVQERLKAGVMYGIFMEGNLAGVIGIHKGGSVGMLYVDKPYRRQGFAAYLTAYLVNRMLEKGWTPYGYVSSENMAVEKVLDKLGFYKATREVSIYKRINVCRKDLQIEPEYGKIQML